MKRKCYVAALLFSVLSISTTLIIPKITNTNSKNNDRINDYFNYDNSNTKNRQIQLPKLNIIGDISNMEDKNDVRTVRIEYESTELNFSSYATLKLQGQFSLDFPKKNYNIKFFKDENIIEKEYIDLKWGAFHKYTIKANWTDNTHSRNIVCSDIAGDINNKYNLFENTPNYGEIDGYPIEIYVNEEYNGLYTMNLNKEYMFYEEEEKKYTLISNQTDYGMRDIVQETSDWNNFEVEVGNVDQTTLDNFNRMLNFIHTSSDEEFKRDIEEYFNLDSLLNYYCYIKFADLWDNVGKNLYFLSYDGKIWYTVFYDLDYSYGSHNTYATSKRKIIEFIEMFPLWKKLEKNFGKELDKRWDELRTDIFTKDYVTNKFDTYYNKIPTESLQNDRNKWPGSSKYSMEKLRNFLSVRIPDSDLFFNTLNPENKPNNSGAENNPENDQETGTNPENNKPNNESTPNNNDIQNIPQNPDKPQEKPNEDDEKEEIDNDDKTNNDQENNENENIKNEENSNDVPEKEKTDQENNKNNNEKTTKLHYSIIFFGISSIVAIGCLSLFLTRKKGKK